MSALVTGLLVTPVKGLRVTARDSVLIGAEGVAEDRRFFIVDSRGRMVNGKRLGALQSIVADYSDDRLELVLRFPDGAAVGGHPRTGPRLDATFYSGTRAASEVLGPWSAALSDRLAEPVRLVEGDIRAVDRGARGAVSLVSRASLEAIGRAADLDGPIDARRLRMLIEVDGIGAHEEDGWIGRTVRAGAALLAIGGHVGRCIVTSRDPESGRSDVDTLAALATYRRDADTTEPLACGVYGEVIEPGRVAVGDPVTLVEQTPEPA